MGEATEEAVVRLRAAVASKKGWTFIERDSGLMIVAGKWRCIDKKGDAIAALLDGTRSSNNMRRDAAKLLDVSVRWVDRFIAGYDGRDGEEKPAFRAGVRFRKRLLGDAA